MELARREIRTERDYQRLEQAIRHYAAECGFEKRDPRYIRYFDSFMKDWEDWVEPTVSTPGFDIGKALEERGLS